MKTAIVLTIVMDHGAALPLCHLLPPVLREFALAHEILATTRDEARTPALERLNHPGGAFDMPHASIRWEPARLEDDIVRLLSRRAIGRQLYAVEKRNRDLKHENAVLRRALQLVTK